MTTDFIGKIVDGHIFLICKDDNGNTIQCPHVELFTEKGLIALPVPQDREIKEPYKRLTKKELALFFYGQDINGNVLEKPSEWHARTDKRHAELMATDKKYRETFNEVMKKVKMR